MHDAVAHCCYCSLRAPPLLCRRRPSVHRSLCLDRSANETRGSEQYQFSHNSPTEKGSLYTSLSLRRWFPIPPAQVPLLVAGGQGPPIGGVLGRDATMP